MKTEPIKLLVYPLLLTNIINENIYISKISSRALLILDLECDIDV